MITIPLLSAGGLLVIAVAVGGLLTFAAMSWADRSTGEDHE